MEVDHGGARRPKGQISKLYSGLGRHLIAILRLYHRTMDDALELPDADVSKLQEQGQGEGTDDGDSSADEEEGGLDWTKLP